MEIEYTELLDLQLQLKEGLESIFPERVWVKAEIASVQVKANGHCYLELSQSDGGSVVAKAKAVIWRNRYLPLITYFRETADKGFEPGMEILARAVVNYSELYGLSLVIDEVEPLLTLGAAELEKRRTIEKLTSEGLIDAQKALALPALPYHLAVISARDAAGFGDFARHLAENEFGFVFKVDLFEAAMQGKDAPASIAAALALVRESEPACDAVLIMRGGGSALDLACFDDYGLCRAIAECPIPVLTAIGHDRDFHVADMVAFDFVKTPTALADRFIDAFAAEDEQLDSYGTGLRLAFLQKISEMSSRIDLIESRIRSSDPRNVLSRGYALVTGDDGRVVKSASAVKVGDKVCILFEDGKLECHVDGKV